MTSALERRLAALEVQRRPIASYVVRLPDSAQGDPAAEHAAVMNHRRRTEWMGPVAMTQREWVAKYGRVST